METSFLRRAFNTVMLGFFAACLLWVFRHFVQEAIDETGSGWKKMFHKGGAEKGG